MHCTTIIPALMCFIVLLLPAGCGSEPRQPQQENATTGIMQGQMAPDFTLTDITGSTFTLSSHRGKSSVMLTFWATWCPYCIQSIPTLSALHKEYTGKSVQVVSVNVAANDPIQKVMAMQKRMSIPYPILYDSDGIVSRLYAVQGIPVNVLIDARGIIRFRGYQLPENIRALFDSTIEKS